MLNDFRQKLLGHFAVQSLFILVFIIILWVNFVSLVSTKYQAS